MGRVERAVYTPDEAAAARYDEQFDEYRQLHDHFGRGGNGVMRRLRAIRRQALAEATGATTAATDATGATTAAAAGRAAHR
jgi:L-ribulokinase